VRRRGVIEYHPTPPPETTEPTQPPPAGPGRDRGRSVLYFSTTAPTWPSRLSQGQTSPAPHAQAIGLAYALLFVIGLFTGDFLGILPLNGADNVLHLLSAIVALVVGLSPVGERTIGQSRLAGAA